MAANKPNTWMEDVPGDVITPEEHMAKLSRHRFHINTILQAALSKFGWMRASTYTWPSILPSKVNILCVERFKVVKDHQKP